MSRFSGWAFLVARQAGAAGLTEAARECFRVAERSCPGGRRGRRLGLYALAAGVLGWRLAGSLAGFSDRLRRRPLPAGSGCRPWGGVSGNR